MPTTSIGKAYWGTRRFFARIVFDRIERHSAGYFAKSDSVCAFYDLANNPLTYDFVGFLCGAELIRSFFVPTLAVYEYHRESQSPHVRERALALQRPHTESIQRALAAGVRVVAGTDAGGHEHGINAREISLRGTAGM